MTEPLTDQQLAQLSVELERPGPHHPTRAEVAGLLAEATRLRAERSDLRAAAEQRFAEIGRAVRYLDAGDPGSARSVLVTAGGGTDRINATPLCHCGHGEAQHQGPDGLGGAQCRVCPGDSERAWHHPFEAEAPADPCRAEPVHQAGSPNNRPA
ncbi:hypothetical protein [Streptacidiphilus cavernicola]|uniref:Uncharacterized protein n=1 Tax=Streptacidiphilus cavernicola TaxID=3342716 RepID=A0ABV6W461_9ACTN